jgi:polysaccharide biosynthesis/export protein
MKVINKKVGMRFIKDKKIQPESPVSMIEPITGLDRVMRIFKFHRRKTAARYRIVFLLIAAMSGPVFGQHDRIQKGDILEINVYNHPDLSKAVIVKNDGAVEYPLISGIPVDGLTIPEFREILTAQLTKYIGEQPILSIRFSSSISILVTVLGQVAVPGEYLIPQSATIQGAISRAGGPTPRAQLDQVKLIRQNDPEKTAKTVNLLRFFIEGDPSLLPTIEEGDVIVVPGVPGSNDVKILGEVRVPGSYTVHLGASVLDVLFLAGGPTKDAALNRVRWVSPLDSVNRAVDLNLNKMLKSKSYQAIPEVRPGDILYVPRQRAGFWRFTYSLIKDVAAIASPIAMVVYYSKYNR